MVFYKKNKNSTLLQEIETVLDVSGAQNYIPIYSRFFTLNTTNWNSINLDNEYELSSICNADYNKATATLKNNTPLPIFLKYSPLLDPLKYLNGKYTSYDFTLPSLTGNFPKLMEVNNSAYTDSFFSYLSSQLLYKHNFIHGIGFYGSYLGIKRKFKYNIEDEIEQLHNSTFFYENNNKLFTLNREIATPSSQKNREHLTLEDECLPLPLEDIEYSIPNSMDSILEIKESGIELVEDLHISLNKSKSTSSKSDTSSQSSNTETEYTDDCSESEDTDCSMFDLSADIHQFPVQIIALEQCKDTLDALLMESIPSEELTSVLFQVIMSLVMYQNLYQFTHNDLHTNNIMYVETTEPYLYYTHKNVHYKVPTYGRIFKIIDFGRAIYTYDGKQFVSDSFHPDGDAATQYNMEPFLDASKPVLEPNYSFDLCRLACSMLDIIPDDTPIYELVEEWCLDDKKRNVLYKKNGEERYPDFKLYKMIARTVHDHIPELQLNKPVFKSYVVSESNDRAIQIS
jgi:hypothetical protein